MNTETLLAALEQSPNEIEFADVMQVIDDNYTYSPTDFKCGDATNSAGTNEGSCKILYFAKMHDLDSAKTPYLFGKFYREDVVNHPDGQDHANIRNFIKHGWEGVSFEAQVLTPNT